MAVGSSPKPTEKPTRRGGWHAVGVLIAAALIKLGPYIALSGLTAVMVGFLCYISVAWWKIGTENAATAKLSSPTEISEAVLEQSRRMMRQIDNRHSVAPNIKSLAAFSVIMLPLLFVPAKAYFSFLLTLVAILAPVALASFIRQKMMSKKMIRQLKDLGYAQMASMKASLDSANGEHEAREAAYEKSSEEYRKSAEEYAQRQRDQEVMKARINYMRG
jgi:hypothetical protein